MNWKAYTVLVYGLLLLIGGIIGHLKANSLASLIMGGISAGIMIGCAWGMLKDNRKAHITALITSVALYLFFGYRFLVTNNFMPAGMMAIISLILIGILILKRKKANNPRNGSSRQ